MKCSYCGRANPPVAINCSSCGLALPPDVEDSPHPTLATAADLKPANLGSKRTLNAGVATVVFICAFVCCALVEILVAFVIGAYGASNGFTYQKFAILLNSSIALVQPIILLASVIFISWKIIPGHLKDVEPTGAAWVPGSTKAITKGLLFGLGWGACLILLYKYFSPSILPSQVGTRTKILNSTGFLPFLGAAGLVLFAPPSEELLFRGVMYGGFRKSFGPAIAAIVTTFIFVLLHLGEAHSFLAKASITLFALAAIWLRLRYRAIGPSIALHIGYNLVLMTVGMSGR